MGERLVKIENITPSSGEHSHGATVHISTVMILGENENAMHDQADKTDTEQMLCCRVQNFTLTYATFV